MVEVVKLSAPMDAPQNVLDVQKNVMLDVRIHAMDAKEHARQYAQQVAA